MKEKRNTTFLVTVALAALIALPTFGRGVDKEELDDDGRGVISDEQYEMMWEGDDIDWYWIADGIRLRDYRVDVGGFDNMSGERDDDMVEALDEGFSEVFRRSAANGNKVGTLTTENAVYWADESNDSKRWIPFAGSHLAQAGVGIEMIFRNSNGEVVALIRHSAREGDDLEDASEELVEDIDEWFNNN